MVSKKQKDGLDLKRCYEFVLNTPEGKKVLADLANESFLVATTAVVGDSHMSSFNEGRRSLFLHILTRLEMEPVGVHKFYKEITDA